MRRLVDGVEIELSDEPLDIVELADRLLVRTPEGSFSAVAVRQGDLVLISFRGRTYRVEPVGKRKGSAAGPESGEIRAPMPGIIVSVTAKQGDIVEASQPIVVLEAMKTQYSYAAPFAGKLEKLDVKVGQNVSEGTLLAFLKPLADNP
jgi:biotin carboxyl carrier protein